MNLQNILIIRLGAIGDTVQTLPFANQLRLNFPQSRIHWIMEDKSLPLWKEQPDIHFIEFPKKKIFTPNLIRHFKEKKKFETEMKKLNLDLAIDLQGLFKSGWIASHCHAKMTLGFHKSNTREGNFLFLDRTLEPIPKASMHKIDFYQSFLETLGGKKIALEDPFGFHLTEKEISGARDLLHRFRLKTPYILLNLGASKQTKRWPDYKFQELILLLKKEYPKYSILLSGAGNEDQKSEIRVLKNLKPGLISSSVNKTNLRELAVLVKFSSALVSADSLALHLGSAFHIPSVGLFGGSALAIETKPYRKEFPGLDFPLPCYPCRKKICSHHSCMEGIHAKRVFLHISELIEKQATC